MNASDIICSINEINKEISSLKKSTKKNPQFKEVNDLLINCYKLLRDSYLFELCEKIEKEFN